MPMNDQITDPGAAGHTAGARRVTARSRRAVAAVLLALVPLAAGCSGRGAGADPAPLRALVISDLNGPYGSVGYAPEVTAAIHRAVRDLRPDVVVVVGDMVAGQSPALADARVREMWAAFDSSVAAPLRVAGIPLLVAVGNHDASAYPAHARDRRLAVEHWRAAPPVAPPLVDSTHFPLRYTARIRDVFVAVWDATRQESTEDEELLEWLRDALTSPESRGATHRVVVGHLPLYPVAVGRDRPGEYLLRGDSLRRELERLGATLFVSGHHHAFFPGRRGDLILLHAGALGSGPRPLVGGRSAAVNALALVDFLPRGASIVSGFEIAPDGALRPISIDSLPPVICSGGHRVLRIDVSEDRHACDAGAGGTALPGPDRRAGEGLRRHRP